MTRHTVALVIAVLFVGGASAATYAVQGSHDAGKPKVPHDRADHGLHLGQTMAHTGFPRGHDHGLHLGQTMAHTGFPPGHDHGLHLGQKKHDNLSLAHRHQDATQKPGHDNKRHEGKQHERRQHKSTKDERSSDPDD